MLIIAHFIFTEPKYHKEKRGKKEKHINRKSDQKRLSTPLCPLKRKSTWKCYEEKKKNLNIHLSSYSFEKVMLRSFVSIWDFCDERLRVVQKLA